MIRNVPRLVPAGKGAAAVVALCLTVAAFPAARAGAAAPADPNASAAALPTASSKSVTIPAADFSRAMWVAASESSTDSTSLLQQGFWERALTNLYAQSPTFSSSQAISQIESLRTHVGTALTAAGDVLAQQPAEFLQAVSSAIAAVDPVGIVRQAVLDADQYFTGAPAASDGAGQSQVSASEDATLAAPATDPVTSSLTTAWTTCNAGDKNFCSAQDSVFADQAPPVKEDGWTIIADDPDLTLWMGPVIHNNPDGSATTSTQGLETANENMVSLTDQFVAPIVTHLNTIWGIQDLDLSATGSAAAATDRQNAQSVAGVDLKALKGDLDDAKTAVQGLAQLAGIFDKTAAKDITAIGTSAIQFADAIGKLEAASAAVGGFATIAGGLAAAAATGNMISAVMGLVSLFGPSSPTPDQLIMQAIGQLQDQMKSFQRDVDARFDQVDKELNVIYTSVMTELSKIEVALGQISDQASDVQATLEQLQDQLISLEATLYNEIRSGFENQKFQDLNTAFLYKGQTGHELPQDNPPNGSFDGYDSEFYTWATHDDSQPDALPTPAYSGPATVLADLSPFSLDENVQYLNQFPQSLGLPAVMTGIVPNPQDWYSGAKAFLQLALEYPNDAQHNQELAAEIQAVMADGQTYQSFEHAITAGTLETSGFIAPNTGAHGALLTPLFRGLLRQYQTDWTQLATDVKADETAWGTSTDANVNGYALNPFGGVDQSVTVQNDGVVPDCGSTAPARALDKATANPFVPDRLEIANRTGRGALTYCTTESWGSFDHDEAFSPNPATIPAIIDNEYFHLNVTLHVRWSNTANDVRTWTFSPVVIGCFTDPDGGPFCPQSPKTPTISASQAVTTGWTGSDIWGRANAITPIKSFTGATMVQDPTAMAEVATDAGYYLVTVEQAMDTYIGHLMQTNATLLTDEKTLDGMKAAIVDYISLGMPQALQNDELLSGMLLGAQSIPDENATSRLGTPSDTHRVSNVFLTQTLSGNSPLGTNDVLSTMTTQEGTRLGTLGGSLQVYLQAIRVGESEGSEMVGATLDRLAVLSAELATTGSVISAPTGTESYGAVPLGTTKTVALHLSNPGLGALSVSKIAVSGGGYSLTSSNCPKQLGAGASCTLNVMYKPTSSTATTGQLSVSSNSAASPNVVHLSGTPTVGTAAATGSGYWMVDGTGDVFAFGSAHNYGGGVPGTVAMTERSDGLGYWIVDASGGVHAFGKAVNFGQHPALRAGERVSSISATPTGAGYWLFTNKGAAFAYGDAHFYGDMRNVTLSSPVVASASTATGHGYFMVGSDGGIFTFGDAHFHGSTGNVHLNKPIIGIAPTPNNSGYWLVASDGGVFAFNAPFRGSEGGAVLNRPVVGLVAYGNGYLMVASDGGVFDFSDKPFVGSLSNSPPPSPIIAIAPL